MEIIGHIFNFLTLAGMTLVLLFLIRLMFAAQKKDFAQRKAFQESYERDRELEKAGIDPLSGELIHDHVPLEEATFLKHEKYLLAECDDELLRRAKETRKPIKLGYFKKEGWTKGLPFYLFFCPLCNNPAVDYKKYGYELYLSCRICEINIRFSVFGVTNPQNLTKFPVGS